MGRNEGPNDLRRVAQRWRSTTGTASTVWADGANALDMFAGAWEADRTLLDEVVEGLEALADEQYPCDTEAANPHRKVWCIAHQSKRCHMDELVANARNLIKKARETTEGVGK